MRKAFNSLRGLGIALAIAAFLVGLFGAWLWMHSNALWNEHLTRSYFAGKALFASLSTGSAAPTGVEIAPLSAADRQRARDGDYSRISGSPQPAFVTNVSILESSSPGASGHSLTLAVISAKFRYPLAEISFSGLPGGAENLGALARVLASYCNDPVVFAQMDDADWLRIDGTAVWGCAAAPTDLRLVAVLVSAIGLATIITISLRITDHFETFAELLRSRRRFGGPDSYEASGPEELRDIVSAINNYLEAERDRLEKRAMVLSGVGHDLGTPATRLRLRAALIEDADLRQRFEADIDQMTGIIESVLTYTRAEINSEAPRQISLSSLVESLVSDYADTGRPVEFRRPRVTTVSGGRSVFMSRQGRRTFPDERRVVVTARPISLQRALSNLIDNALKYGRRATVQLETDADTATIVVEDQGTGCTPGDLEKLIAPYRRGDNTSMVPGFGLGLTIVASIAIMHGGALSFEAGAKGIRARFSISRN